MESGTSSGRQSVWIRFALLAAAALLLFAIGRQLPLDAWLDSLRASLAALGAWGPVAFTALYIAAALLLVPGSILTLAAGALFGVVTGTLTVSVAATTSAALAFLIARYFARDALAHRTTSQPRFAAVDRAIGEQGWKIVGLLRLSPVIPFSLSNYLYGLTAIPFGPYVLVTWLAMLPGTLLYVTLGAMAAAGVESVVGGGKVDASRLEWTARIVGVVATAAVAILIARTARKALRETTDIEDAEVP